jgi:hypothetical protein
MQMNMKSISFVAVALAATACGTTYPAPTQRLVDAQSANRSAMELGADKEPQAKLHYKLAEEQVAKANVVLKNGDNRRADMMLVRAKADADLALALTKEAKAKDEAQKAAEQAKASANQGAVQ